jgi:hypothetical protein
LKQSWQRWKKQILIVGLIVVVIVGLVGVLWASNVFGWRAWRLQEVEHFIGASIPAGAANIHFATQNQKTRIIWLRFDISPETDITPFLNQMGISTPLRSGFTPFPAANPQEAGYAWWDASTATDYAGTYGNTGQKIIEVLLDNSRYTVYVRAYAFSN